MRAILGILIFCWTFSLYVYAVDPPPTEFSPGVFAPNANFTYVKPIDIASSANFTDDSKSPPVAVKRIDPPSEITLLVKENPPGVPDDTMIFTFDNIRMADDDVTIAVLAAFRQACKRLSLVSGKDSNPLERDFYLRDVWYRFEIGWDAHGDQPLLMSELYEMIMKVQEVIWSYNMRQVTFKYLLKGRFHAIGRLRNPATPPPSRRIALGPKSVEVPDGHIVWSEYGLPMDFEVVATAMMGLLYNSWGCMVSYRRSSHNILTDKNPFTYQDLRGLVHLEVSTPEELSVEDVMDIAYYIAVFGRIYFMEEHQCVLTNTYYPTETQVKGTISKGEE
ncbi:MAG: hypothetical protein LQ343_007407 [Gyalolechia ehrenbergii]|nr:MAG: hypothetical protein LQ343_007407 [Gyalolechia ehrenbergii]